MARQDGKYEGLKQYLRRQTSARLAMRFAEVEGIVGAKLPRSAKLYRTWWSNDPEHHVQAAAWLEAGYRTEQVDMDEARLVFVKVGHASGMAKEPKMFGMNADAPKSGPHPLIGAMKGTFTIEEGWDLTKPALDPEELEAWEANLDRMADELQDKLSGKQE